MTRDGFPKIALYRAVFEATEPGMLPPLPTTALHGAPGRALWREVCLAPARQTCRGCPAMAQCPYPPLFEPVPAPAGRDLGVTDEAPRALFLAPEPPLVPT